MAPTPHFQDSFNQQNKPFESQNDHVNKSTSKNLNDGDNEILTMSQQQIQSKQNNGSSKIPPQATAALNQYMEQKRNGQFPAFSHPYQPMQNPTQVPLQGPLKSTSLIVQQQLHYTNHPSQNVNGMIGEILQVPLTKK